MLACRYVVSSLPLLHAVFAEVACARAEEERQKALIDDSAGDSSLDRMSWSFDSLRRWERKLKIQHREYKAECERVVLLYEGKVKILEARENALLWQERDVVGKEYDLIEREEILKAKEQDYNSLCQDVMDDCFKFRKEYRYRHKVVVCLLHLVVLYFYFRIADLWRTRTRMSDIIPSLSFAGLLTSMTAIWYVKLLLFYVASIYLF